MPIQVGLIGYGSSVKIYHYPFISSLPDLLQIRAVVQRSPAPPDGASGHVAIDHPDIIHYRKAEDLLADREIELVIICTPVSSHKDLALAAIAAGKHVVVEKAFAATSQDADEMIAAAKEAGVVLTVYQSQFPLAIRICEAADEADRRYDADFRTLQELWPLKPFGKISEAEFHHDLDGVKWIQNWKYTKREPGEGMLYTAGSHALDHALFLFGKPTSVTALLRNNRGVEVESEVEDTYTITMGYEPDPLVVHVKTNPVSVMPYPLTFFIRGDEGSFVKFGQDPQVSHTRQGLLPGSPGFGKESEEAFGQLSSRTRLLDSQEQRGDLWWGKIPSEEGDWQGYYIDLVKAIKGKAPLSIDPRLSRDGIRVIELAIESSEKRCTVPWS